MNDKLRILGVDDSLTIRKALELVLKPAGYVLELAATGAEAVEKARGFRPAAVLLDFILPDMRGTEVCRRLAADPETAEIPVVLISAKGAEIRQAYQDVGNVASYVTKPFTPEAIIDVVAEVLARPRVPADVETRGSEAPAARENLWDADRPSDGVAAELSTGADPTVPNHLAERETTETAERAQPLGSESVGVGDAVESLEVEGWDDTDAEPIGDDPSTAEVLGAEDAPRRETLEMMLEALSAGLEGVYVEEVDTVAGAAADEAKSYTDLVARLTQQLEEALGQAMSGARYALCNDGSVRSLDDVLFDAYRRLCRLLFRATAAEMGNDVSLAGQSRVLVACHRDSEIFDVLRTVSESRNEWQALFVSERFRQLPILIRLYGPTHLVIDATSGGALLDQLSVIRCMPESQRLRIIGITRSGVVAENLSLTFGRVGLAEGGLEVVLTLGPNLCDELCEWLMGSEESMAQQHGFSEPMEPLGVPNQ